MEQPRYVRHIPTGRKHVWHELYNQDDFEPWDDPQVIDVEARVVPISAKTLKLKKAGLAAPVDDTPLSADASRRLP